MLGTSQIIFKVAKSGAAVKTLLAENDAARAHCVNWYKSAGYTNKDGFRVPGGFRPRYGIFQSASDFKNWYCRKYNNISPECGLCENIAKDAQVALYFDIDCKGLLSDDPAGFPTTLAHIKRLINARLKSLGSGWKPQYAVADGSRMYTEEVEGGGSVEKFKYSLHVVVPNLIFPNVAQVAAFVRDLGDIPHLDTAVYRSKGSFNLMRLPGSYKWGDRTKTPFKIRQDLSSGWNRGVECTDFLIGYETAHPELRYDTSHIHFMPNSKLKKIRPSSKRMCNSNDAVKLGDINNNVISNWISKRLGGVRVEERDSTIDDTRAFYVYNCADAPLMCPLAKRVHRNNNAIAHLYKTGHVFLICFNECCKKCGRLYMGNAFADQDDADVWPDKLKKHMLVNEYDSEFVQPIKFAPETKMYMLAAPMGTGKTTQVSAFIKKNNDKRILFIVNRVSFCNSIKGLFPGFKTYIEDIDAPHLICQYESLWRITTDFDIVIIDECRSVCNNISSHKTNGQRLYNNANTLKSFIQLAKKCILLDADLEVDGCVPRSLCTLVSPRQLQLERYTRHKLVRDLEWVMNEDDWFAKLARDILAGKRVAVCSRVTFGLEQVVDLCEKHGISYKAYQGKTSDKKKKDWIYPNTTFADVQVLVYTSTVTVGVDISILFDKVYLYTTLGVGCAPRELWQMVGRFRKLRDPLVTAYFPPHALQGYKSNYNEIMASFNTRRHELLAIGYVRVSMGNGKVKLVPEWYTQAACYKEDELVAAQLAYRVFKLGMLRGGRVFQIHKLEVSDPRDNPQLTPEEVKTEMDIQVAVQASVMSRRELRKKLAESHTEKMREVFDNLTVNGGVHTHFLVQDAASVVAGQDADDYQRAVVSVGVVLGQYETGAFETYDQYCFAHGNIAQIRRYALATRVPVDDLIKADIEYAESIRWVEPRYTPLNCVIAEFQTISKLLNIKNFFTHGESFEQDVLNSNADEIQSACNRIAALRNVSTNEQLTFKHNNPQTALRRELKILFGANLGSTRKMVKGVKTKRYHVEYDPVFLEFTRGITFNKMNIGSDIPKLPTITPKVKSTTRTKKKKNTSKVQAVVAPPTKKPDEKNNEIESRVETMKDDKSPKLEQKPTSFPDIGFEEEFDDDIEAQFEKQFEDELTLVDDIPPNFEQKHTICVDTKNITHTKRPICNGYLKPNILIMKTLQTIDKTLLLETPRVVKNHSLDAFRKSMKIKMDCVVKPQKSICNI